MAEDRLHHDFTIGITDDITHLSLPVKTQIDAEPSSRLRALFYGLGADGTVSANKNTIKIIGENTDLHAQGYFVYDSKKSGGTTVSHLRIDQHPVEAPYLIEQAEFIACHQFQFINKLEMVERAAPQATLLLNSPHSAENVWQYLPREVQQQIIDKQLSMYVIDAVSLARELGLKNRINTIMQAGFFALSEMMPTEQALEKLNQAIEQSYSKRGPAIVEANQKAVAATVARIEQVTIPSTVTSTFSRPAVVSERAPDLVKHVSAMMMADKGDLLPVSAFPVDGTWPTATSQWEKRNIAQEIPVWEEDLCTQCNICTLVCPHAAIRAKAVNADDLADAPEGFKVTEYKQRDFKGQQYTSKFHHRTVRAVISVPWLALQVIKTTQAVRPSTCNQKLNTLKAKVKTTSTSLNYLSLLASILSESMLVAVNCYNPCLSSLVHVLAVAKPHISSYSPNCLVIVC
ncbi:2-oxoacid:acceptor oxidoreductase family protein [Photobacterium sanguinicancri]|uniref:2-oxoacid:acceptor oxidoreductase family protein n=1 Tax=Photobacterium sanguinicancri TaxID=875932 RepID=UPI001F1516D1|nr:2-oxoacid:acceptor oxidoreductase family protein [Photobacterium sanguinicancri]